jgi:hypothetical protein
VPRKPAPTVPDLKALSDPATSALHWQKGPSCTIGQALDTLPSDQAAHLAKALDNTNARAIDIAMALEALGVRMSAHTVQRHRRGVCRCDR